MNLQEIKGLKQGGTFKYKGAQTKVEWREQVDEMVGLTQKGEEMWIHHFSMYFKYEGRDITLLTMHPNPKIVQLDNYTK